MANFRNTEQAAMPQGMQTASGDWNSEIRMPPSAADDVPRDRYGQPWPTPWTAADTRYGLPPAAGNGSAGTMQPRMQTGVSDDVIEAPVSSEEAYLGSLKAMLLKNRGNYIVATFLIGTQNTTSWEGILYAVGNDYMTIYQPERDRYVVCDIYSLKYMEFYDTRRRELCNSVLQGGNGAVPQW